MGCRRKGDEMKIHRSPALVAGLLMLLAGFLRAEVKDSTGLFSEKAVEQANASMRQLKQQYGKEMVVEVFPEIPADLKDQYNANQKETFFRQWGVKRATELNIN